MYYDVATHCIKLSFEDVKMARRGKPVVTFEDVSNIAISSLDNLVIGECTAVSIEQGKAFLCRMVFETFGESVEMKFTSGRMICS